MRSVKDRAVAEFIINHPDYFILLMVCFFLVIKTIIHVISDRNDNRDSDNNGGIITDDPILDLPPGITLPRDSPVDEPVL